MRFFNSLPSLAGQFAGQEGQFARPFTAPTVSNSNGGIFSKLGSGLSAKLAALANPNQGVEDGAISQVAGLKELLARNRENTPAEIPAPLMPPTTPIDQWRSFMDLAQNETTPEIPPDALQQVLLGQALGDTAAASREQRTSPMISNPFTATREQRTSPMTRGTAPSRFPGIPGYDQNPFRY